jgi:hypothetical protein
VPTVAGARPPLSTDSLKVAASRHTADAPRGDGIAIAADRAPSERAPAVALQRSRRDKGDKGASPQRVSRPYDEPAFAAGYEGGFEKGASDGREGERYDPVRHRDYRDAERGYTSAYGSRDAYRNNFRAGFRQGYEEGYRTGTRSR